MHKALCVLGSTGSIGRSTLNVVEMFPDRFSVKALTAFGNIQRLARQIDRFSPQLAVVGDVEHARGLKSLLPVGCKTEILWGSSGYCEAASHPQVHTVVGAMVGAAGLAPTLAAIDAGKDIALANKETLVMAGHLVMEKVAAAGVRLLPIDSEHSAIFQCLAGNRPQDADRILLTASGGPFLNRAKETFGEITPEEALKHPNWQMGNKITIDSATLMNKGLEVIEASWLFNMPPQAIEVVIHPQSIVHSMVAFADGVVMAQLGIPDMKAAIAYALSYPERLRIGLPAPDFKAIGGLRFSEPDRERFPCLALAFEACSAGGTYPAVLNAANEIAVAAFLEKRIGFTDIPEVVGRTMQRHDLGSDRSLEAIVEADHWARQTADAITREMTR